MQKHEEIYEKGLSELSAGRIQEGIDFIEKSIIQKPGWFEPLGHLAWAYFSIGYFSKAFNIYLEILDRDKTCLEALNKAGDCKLELGEIDQAEAFFSKSLSITSQNAEALIGLIQVNLKKFDQKISEKLFNDLSSQISPNSPFQKELRLLSKKISLQKSGDGYFGKRHIGKLKKKWGILSNTEKIENINLLKEICGIPHASFADLLELGELLFQTRNSRFGVENPEEREAWERAVKIDPQNLQAWLGYLRALLDSRRTETVFNAAKEAGKYLSNSAEIKIYHARSAEKLSLWSDAVRGAKEAVKIKPESIGYQVNLALYLESNGDEENEKIWKKIAEENKNNPIGNFVDLFQEEPENQVRSKWLKWMEAKFDGFFPQPGWEPQSDQPCKFCGAVDSRPLFKKHPCGWYVVRCKSCGLVQVRPEPVLSELVEIYDGDYMDLHQEKAKELLPPDKNKKPAFFIFGNLFDWLEEKGFGEFEKSLEGKGRLLDVGCGCGLTLHDFVLRDWQVEGIEVSKPAVEFLKSYKMKVECATFEEYAPPDGTYDAVTMNHVIEHVPDPGELLKQIHKSIKPDGRLIMVTPNWLGLPGIITGPEWFNDQEHVTYFSVEDLVKMTEAAGFEVIAWRTRVGIESETPRFGWDSLELSDLFKTKIEKYGLGDVIELYAKA